MASEPLVSIILATDTYATIRSVVQCLRKQTMRESIEVVLVGRSLDDLAQARKYESEFAAIRLVEHPVLDLAPARGAGVRAAAAPYIFIGETHSYPSPEMTRVLLDTLRREDCAAVTPAIANGNPNGALSCSGLILDYGQWINGLPPGPAAAAPIYNALYVKSVLLELGGRLDAALGQTDDLGAKLRNERRRVLFEPGARIDHINVTQGRHWTLNRFYCGTMIAGNRSKGWSPLRRLAYMGGWFLIPVVLYRRIAQGAAVARREHGLPPGTVAAVWAGLILRALGEIPGYAGLLEERALSGMYQYEVHKLKYAAHNVP